MDKSILIYLKVVLHPRGYAASGVPNTLAAAHSTPGQSFDRELLGFCKLLALGNSVTVSEIISV